MYDYIKLNIFSISGISISIGVLGFLSGITTIFLDVNSSLSVKWFLFIILIFISIFIIFLKIMHDLWIKSEIHKSHEVPIKAILEDQILVIRKNDNFINNILVGCYSINDDIERLAYIGVVHHVQDKLIQIRLIQNKGILKQSPYDKEAFNTLIIRPVIPFNAITEIKQEEI
ncbi:hypothetical protein [Sulfurospirillum arcachonense]|uniref:hypothetical protein n=1 Tax=Sulfurospirillum arcachonense TaxID=57666 RepID=UPI00046800CF|nr:hypothetical protein [Sulfurospirillum arcachonense]